VSQVIRMGASGAVGNPMIAAAALFVALVCQVHAADAGERLLAGAAGKPVQEIRVVLPDKAGPEMRTIAAAFGRQVSERCGAHVSTDGEAPLRVELAVRPGIGKEGFSISKAGAGNERSWLSATATSSPPTTCCATASSIRISAKAISIDSILVVKLAIM